MARRVGGQPRAVERVLLGVDPSRVVALFVLAAVPFDFARIAAVVFPLDVRAGALRAVVGHGVGRERLRFAVFRTFELVPFVVGKPVAVGVTMTHTMPRFG